MRLRFAPSPTGALHIGGIRTALYDYLLAKKHGGTFILRIEDTDQKRYVEGAEDYIINALRWCGLEPDEGPGIGGDYGPYRQSERKDLYQKYIKVLLEGGHAYYAFDSAEDLDAMREKMKAEGKHTFQYDASTRMQMKNSLSMSAEDVKALLESGATYTIRFKMPNNETVTFKDLIRDEVTFSTETLDDKVLMKSDGLPTYHMANIVDDHTMEITHVIRGEEWLPSTGLHVLMYRAFGWEDTMPQFAHLPLILKPNGKGKLSKRDGKKFGFPVFPLSWNADTEEESFVGFKEMGFDANAVNNFLVFLGWNPGTEQEMFSMDEMIDAFSLERVGKSGARFDYDKARWYNQQYLMKQDNNAIANNLQTLLKAKGVEVSDDYVEGVAGMMKERVHFVTEILDQSYYFFEPVKSYDEKVIRKRWKPEKREKMNEFSNAIKNIDSFDATTIETSVKKFMEEHELGFGDVLPVLRLAVSGTTKGPSVFDMMALMGKQEVTNRMDIAYKYFDEVKEKVNNA